ncbi:MAG: hypothetical protein JRJ47_01450 [Deltaproteobacteria bacterium]|nr:hypothetical protein [Deltaproteobacteria bacterium]
MITKEHIRKHLDTLTSGTLPEQGHMPADVWEQLQEYLTNHYERLGKDARAYANNIFDQLEVGIEQRIDSIPDGTEKKVLHQKLSTARGERSPLPVLYLDTPVIENIIRHALGQRLPEPVAENSKALYEETLSLVKNGKLICPENSFHREVLQMGDTQARHGLNIMKLLSDGLSFRHSQSIEDFQVFRAVRGFVKGNGPVNYRGFWQDAFDPETVGTIMKRRPLVEFKHPLAISEKPGEIGSESTGPVPVSTRLRIRYDKSLVKNDHQLQQKTTRHLRDLVRLGLKYQSLMEEGQRQHLDGFWAGQKTDLPLALWKHYGGTPEGLEGLISFYESDYFGNVPAIEIKRAIWNALSEPAKGLERLTGPADVSILSLVLSYTDIVILDRKMTDVVRDRLELHAKCDTQIYSTDEHDLIMATLREMTHSE